MTTNPTNGGGRSNTGLSLPDGDSPYGHTYYYHSKNSGQTDEKEDQKILATMFPIFAVIIFIVIWLLCLCARNGRSRTPPEEPEPVSVNTVRQLGPTRQSSEAGGAGWVDTAPSSSTVAAMDVQSMPPVWAAEPPLVCTYRKADGWRDASCGVCLAELADGEAIRVPPPCMHYFPDACVGEWLRVHATCPLCRAPLVAPPAAA